MAKKPTAPPVEEVPPAPQSDLLTMTKPGEEPITVHPTQVGPWQKQGWNIEEK